MSVICSRSVQKGSDILEVESFIARDAALATCFRTIHTEVISHLAGSFDWKIMVRRLNLKSSKCLTGLEQLKVVSGWPHCQYPASGGKKTSTNRAVGDFCTQSNYHRRAFSDAASVQGIHPIEQTWTKRTDLTGVKCQGTWIQHHSAGSAEGLSISLATRCPKVAEGSVRICKVHALLLYLLYNTDINVMIH